MVISRFTPDVLLLLISSLTADMCCDPCSAQAELSRRVSF